MMPLWWIENVERHIAQGRSPKEAARRAMDEVTGPILAITSVLAAVFIPSAFLSDCRGVLSPVRADHRHFDDLVCDQLVDVVAGAGISSAFGPHQDMAQADRLTRIMDRVFGGFFRRFNAFFDRLSNNYVGAVRQAVRGSIIVLVLYAGFPGLTPVGVPAGS